MIATVITLVANIAMALSFVVALIFGVVEVRASERDRRETFAENVLRNFQTREFAELMHYILSHDLPENIQELRSLPEHDQIIFIQLSQQMEFLGLAVSGKFISIGLVERILGSFVTVAWGKYKPVFLSLRKNDPFAGEYFQWLAEHVSDVMKNRPRQPAYTTPAVLP